MVEVVDQTHTLAEVASHNDAKSAWIVLNDKVYDVSEFLEEHPGGDEVLLEQAGKDATEIFNDVGHSREAMNLAERYMIGKLLKTGAAGDEATISSACKKSTVCWGEIISSPTWSNFLIPVAISCVVYIFYRGVKTMAG